MSFNLGPDPLIDHLHLRIIIPTLLKVIIIGVHVLNYSICRLASSQIIVYAVTSPGWIYLILSKSPSSETVLRPWCWSDFWNLEGVTHIIASCLVTGIIGLHGGFLTSRLSASFPSWISVHRRTVAHRRCIIPWFHPTVSRDWHVWILAISFILKWRSSCLVSLVVIILLKRLIIHSNGIFFEHFFLRSLFFNSLIRLPLELILYMW